MCEISASSWFYYKEICCYARSQERKIRQCQTGKKKYNSIETQKKDCTKPTRQCGITKFTESSILVLLESCLQTYVTYTIAECAVNKLLMMDRGTLRNM
jgi:hypothetical protein